MGSYVRVDRDLEMNLEPEKLYRANFRRYTVFSKQDLLINGVLVEGDVVYVLEELSFPNNITDNLYDHFYKIFSLKTGKVYYMFHCSVWKSFEELKV